MRTLILGTIGIAMIALAAPGYADSAAAECNRTIAVALGSAYKVVNGIGDPVEQCTEIGFSLFAFLELQCVELIDEEELRGLITASNAPFEGEPSPLGNTICTSIDLCGFLGELPATICPTFPRP